MEHKLFDPKRIIKVPITDIRVNTWNPKEEGTPEYHKVVKSLKKNGLKGFIAVRTNPNVESTYEILDGHQRYTAALELGYKEIYVYDEGTIDDKTAKEYTVWWQQQVPFEKVAEAHLITELIKEYGDMESLPYTSEEIHEMEILSEFSFDQYDDKADDEKDNTYKLTFVYPDEDEANMIADYFNRADSSREDILVELVRSQMDKELGE